MKFKVGEFVYINDKDDDHYKCIAIIREVVGDGDAYYVDIPGLCSHVYYPAKSLGKGFEGEQKQHSFKVGEYVRIIDGRESYYDLVGVIREIDYKEDVYYVDIRGVDYHLPYHPEALALYVPTNGKSKEVVSPHYDGSIQPIELMQAQMSKEEFIGFLKGNIIKYASRLGKKDAPQKEAKKIVQYAQWLLEVTEGKTINPHE